MPRDVASWLAVARPEGRQCLVVAADGRTSSRARNGAPLHRSFQSALPGGSSGGASTTGVTPGTVVPPPPTFPVALKASHTLPSAGSGGEPADSTLAASSSAILSTSPCMSMVI